MTKKYRICSVEEREARKWGARFCSIKTLYAPESTAEVPATAQEFIDSVTQMLPPSKLKKIGSMLTDALRTTHPKVFKDIQSHEDIKWRMKHIFGRDITNDENNDL